MIGHKIKCRSEPSVIRRFIKLFRQRFLGGVNVETSCNAKKQNRTKLHNVRFLQTYDIADWVRLFHHFCSLILLVWWALSENGENTLSWLIRATWSVKLVRSSSIIKISQWYRNYRKVNGKLSSHLLASCCVFCLISTQGLLKYPQKVQNLTLKLRHQVYVTLILTVALSKVQFWASRLPHLTFKHTNQATI